MTERTWKLQPQECEGTYTFSGRYFATCGVVADLKPEEINGIISDVKARVAEKGGADYLQVFKSNDGKTIFCIDNLNAEMRAKAGVNPDDDYFTLMFNDEY